ncbi:MAG: hypothetical protein M0024_01065 [Nitrospiraceae bacterium]|nr:hypothetical protein [Nitrospiraceae bacterium]
MKTRRLRTLGLAVIVVFMFAGLAGAATMGGSGGGMMGGGNGPFSTSTNGSFGMMNGMAGSPVVGDDGTAYMVTYDTSAAAGTTPASNVFQSKVIAVDLGGNIRSLTLNGIVSRPVIADGYLFASTSMSNMADFMLVSDYRNYQGNGQSVVYGMPLNFTASTKPVAIAIDGNFASVPVVVGNHLYIMGSDFGNAMMTGSNTFNMMYGNYNFNSNGNAKTYMYIFNLDGSLVSKTLIQ